MRVQIILDALRIIQTFMHNQKNKKTHPERLELENIIQFLRNTLYKKLSS